MIIHISYCYCSNACYLFKRRGEISPELWTFEEDVTLRVHRHDPSLLGRNMAKNFSFSQRELVCFSISKNSDSRFSPPCSWFNLVAQEWEEWEKYGREKVENRGGSSLACRQVKWNDMLSPTTRQRRDDPLFPFCWLSFVIHARLRETANRSLPSRIPFSFSLSLTPIIIKCNQFTLRYEWKLTARSRRN